VNINESTNCYCVAAKGLYVPYMEKYNEGHGILPGEPDGFLRCDDGVSGQVFEMKLLVYCSV